MARGFSRLFFPRAARRGEAFEVGNASLLEASRRSWKEGGAISQGRYKGTQSAQSVGSWSSGGHLSCFWWSSSWSVLVVVFFFLVA